METINNTSDSQNTNDVAHVTKFVVEKPKKNIPIAPVVIGGILALIAFSLVWFFVIKDKNFKDIQKDINQVRNDGKSPQNLVMNPLTGEKVSEDSAKSWIGNRPLAAMINNFTDARPQSGLINADLVYEIVAEGGITRFLAFFLSETPAKIGPIRSTREYYLVLVKELGDAMLMHEGYSPQAKEAIDTWPVRSLFRGGASEIANWRDTSKDVAWEHTLFTDGQKLRKFADEELGWSGKKEFTSWKFKDNATRYEKMSAASNISIDFWYKGDYSAIFKYNPENNTYLRYVGYDSEDKPIPHQDRDSGKQIEVKNLIVQFVNESAIEGDDKNRLAYDFIGSGTAKIFLDGKVIDASWSKGSMEGRTTFYDLDGAEIEFNRGKIWISIVPERNIEQVVYN